MSRASPNLTPGHLLRVVVDGETRVLARTQSGVIRALDGICTHQHAELAEGDLEDDVLWCPFHGAGFDVHTGAVASLPAVTALRRYDVRLEGDDIFVSRTPITDQIKPRPR